METIKSEKEYIKALVNKMDEVTDRYNNSREIWDRLIMPAAITQFEQLKIILDGTEKFDSKRIVRSVMHLGFGQIAFMCTLYEIYDEYDFETLHEFERYSMDVACMMLKLHTATGEMPPALLFQPDINGFTKPEYDDKRVEECSEFTLDRIPKEQDVMDEIFFSDGFAKKFRGRKQA